MYFADVVVVTHRRRRLVASSIKRFDKKKFLFNMAAIPLTEEDLHELYLWVDEIPLSRPKRNIARDFSDGICVAEIVKHFFPKLVELHNYAPANSTGQKMANWNTLNARVFRKLHFEVPAEEVRDITSAVPGAVERFLRALRTKIVQIKQIQEQRHAAGGRDSDDFGAPPVYSHAASAPSADGLRRPPAAFQQPPPLQQQPASGRPQSSAPAVPSSTQGLRQLLDEKDRTILELRESVALLSDKVARMEELLKVKDDKIMRYKQQLGLGR